VVVHVLRVQGTDDAVVTGHEDDRRQEDGPVLVQRDHAEDHEEVEVHLDETVGQVHQDRRRHDEPRSGHHGSDAVRMGGGQHPLAERGRGRRERADQDRQGLDEAVPDSVAHEDGEDRDRPSVDPQDREDGAMPSLPLILAQRYPDR
jgi:hypothetical protein